MVCKNSLVFGLLFILEIDLIFAKKTFNLRKLFKDPKSLIRNKAIAKALTRVMD